MTIMATLLPKEVQNFSSVVSLAPFLQPDPFRRPDAAIPREAEIDVPGQRNKHHPREQHEPWQQIPPEPAAGAGGEQTLAAALLRPPRRDV
jgi:hypothetical protein